MSRRKTTRIIDAINRANESLKCSLGDDEAARGFRKGVACMIQSIMFKANVYAGFRYLESHEIRDGCAAPGIAYRTEDGLEVKRGDWYGTDPDERARLGWGMVFPDETRVAFFIHHCLTRD